MQGVPSFNEPMSELGKRFLRAFERATPDFQAKVGYEVDAPGQADMTIASNAVRRVCCQRCACLVAVPAAYACVGPTVQGLVYH